MPFPVEDQYIDKAESELGAKLPESYRLKIKAENGGELPTDDDDWILHPIFDTSDRKRIARTANHVVLETRNARQWQGFPEGAMCIADNGSGDKLVLLRDGYSFGDAVFVWWHETGALKRIADSLGELIEVE
ncbi:SMI1/KNR4 family protein [Rhizobium sp. TH2]|uniref:SMI1/KNR4 family protein n=1 Tax=Rhizobium sp. TH2 TaxID=2775403 RepID=UPI00215803AA|nr:SMI1/KNR4 family protein [Rhizobium sp. TH2]UVC10132.1 SMI1/KNR4 family protein [Rhizobium sp. TH2]